jgi:ankyrin repeat protein
MRTNDNKEQKRKMDYIHHYVETNDIENVRYVVTCIPHLTFFVPTRSETRRPHPFQWNGLTVNSYNEQGLLPLNIAHSNQYKEIVEVLLDHKADPHLLDDYNGSNALHYAAAANNINYVRLFAKTKRNDTALGIACDYLNDDDDYKEVVNYLDQAMHRKRLLQFCIGLKQIISHYDLYTKNAFRDVALFI